MTLKLPAAPLEVPREVLLDPCAPRFRLAVESLLVAMGEQGYPARISETLRSAKRQAYLYGFGRQYDDGRGVVTKARTNLTSWHGYGLAADIVHETRWWSPKPVFWYALGEIAEAHGLTWGGRWKSPDRPHVQWGGCPVSPRGVDRDMLATLGMEPVWDAVGAV